MKLVNDLFDQNAIYILIKSVHNTKITAAKKD